MTLLKFSSLFQTIGNFEQSFFIEANVTVLFFKILFNLLLSIILKEKAKYCSKFFTALLKLNPDLKIYGTDSTYENAAYFLKEPLFESVWRPMSIDLLTKVFSSGSRSKASMNGISDLVVSEFRLWQLR